MKKFLSVVLPSCFLVSCSAGTPLSGSASPAKESTDTSEVTNSVSRPTGNDITLVVSTADEAERLLVVDLLPDFIASRNYGFEVEVQIHQSNADAVGKSAYDVSDILFANVESIAANIDAGKEFESIDASAIGNGAVYGESAFKKNDAFICYPFYVVPHELVYYDKSVFDEGDLATWDSVLAKAKTSGKTISWDTDSIFAKTAFFYGAGAKTEFSYGKDFAIAKVEDTYASAGLPAAKAMSRIYADSSWMHYSFYQGGETVPALLVGGIWNLDAAKELFGDNFGVAGFPGYLSGDEAYPCKAAVIAQGIVAKATDDEQKRAVVNDIVQYLSSAEVQKAYAKAVDLALPAKKSVLKDEDMDSLHRAFAAQTDQGFSLPENYDWLYTYLPELEGNIRSTAGAATDRVLQGYLDDYHRKVIAMK